MHVYLNTQRLVLRDFLPDDWPALHALYLLPETVRYNPSGYPENETATRQLVSNWVDMLLLMYMASWPKNLYLKGPRNHDPLRIERITDTLLSSLQSSAQANQTD